MLEPEEQASNQDHGAVVLGTLLVAGCDPPPLLQTIDQPLDLVALAIHFRLESTGPSPVCPFPLPLFPLVASLGDHVANAAAPQQPAALRIAVAFIRYDPVGSL